MLGAPRWDLLAPPAATCLTIPIGKLALYTACGGIAPHRVLPVCLDAGTNNEKHLKDEFYMGVQEKRLEGAEYYEMVDEFMQARSPVMTCVCFLFFPGNLQPLPRCAGSI